MDFSNILIWESDWLIDFNGVSMHFLSNYFLRGFSWHVVPSKPNNFQAQVFDLEIGL